MYGDARDVRERLGSAGLTALLVGAIGWVLVTGLTVWPRRTIGDALATFDVVPPAEPPVKVVPKRQASQRPEGRAAPAGLRSQATEVVAPPPPIPVPPPPIVAAPVAGVGRAATQGAAERPGPGPGAGGIGDGRGSGGDGDGDGSGYETRPRWVRGTLSFRDGWQVAGDDVIGRKISVRCTLRTDQRLTACVVARSTGIAALDQRVCELIERRFRYTPWRDGQGRAVESTILIDQAWYGEDAEGD